MTTERTAPPPLHVGIDGYNLAMPTGTGVATYARTLAAAVRAMGGQLDLLYGVPVAQDAPADLRETLFYSRLAEERGNTPAPPPSLRMKVRRLLMTPETRTMIPIPRTGRVITGGLANAVPDCDRLFTRGMMFDVCARYFRRFGRFMPVRMENPPAIMHWTYPLPIRLVGAANVYTIHDLVPLRLPYASLEDKRYYSRLIDACIRTGDHIVTVSEASRRDIIDIFKADPRQVTNTYQPVDLPGDVADAGRLDRRLDRLFDLQRDGYLLFFGAIEPKKNLGRLIEAYLSSEVETPLVIVGSTGWKSDQELRLLHGASGTALKAAGQVRRIDYLPRAMLADLIRGARAVMFPSLYEGFGLPALEALAAGTPLLASRTASLPEVAGDAAVLVNPLDVDAIAAGIRRIDGDEPLRDRLRLAGPVQAARFAMDHYRARLEPVYRGVLDRRAQARDRGRPGSEKSVAEQS